MKAGGTPADITPAPLIAARVCIRRAALPLAHGTGRAAERTNVRRAGMPGCGERTRKRPPLHTTLSLDRSADVPDDDPQRVGTVVAAGMPSVAVTRINQAELS